MFKIEKDSQFSFYCDSNEFSGVIKIANKVCNDVELFIGKKPSVNQVASVSEIPNEENQLSLIFGTIEKSSLIQNLEKDGKIDLSNIRGKNEVYLFNVTDNQIGPINHFPVTNLDGGFWVRHRSSVRDLYVGVIVVKVIFVIKILSRGIRQHQYQGTVIVPMIFSYAKYRRRYALIEVPIASYQKIYILIFVNKFSNLVFQKILYLYNVVHISVTKKRHRINPHISRLVIPSARII